MNVLITAGPTREPLDPVRFLSNRSSGKMGYALAHAFAELGHRVLLVSGPSAQPIPGGVDFVHVETAEDMFKAVQGRIGRMDIAVFAAAVADFTPVSVSSQKIKKLDDRMVVELVRTKDILGSARSVFGFEGTLVGFAAETENLILNARRKLESKNCDLIVANDVTKAGLGFDSDCNEVALISAEGEQWLPASSKIDLADRIAEFVLKRATGRG